MLHLALGNIVDIERGVVGAGQDLPSVGAPPDRPDAEASTPIESAGGRGEALWFLNRDTISKGSRTAVAGGSGMKSVPCGASFIFRCLHACTCKRGE